MLKLNLQYFGHLMRRADSIEKTLILGTTEAEGEGGNRERDGWRPSPTRWTKFEQAPGDGEGQGSLACCNPWSHKESYTTEQLNNNIHTHTHTHTHTYTLRLYSFICQWTISLLPHLDYYK